MKVFKVLIRIVFLFAYGAFLYASLRHIAYFFANFEPANTDWTGAYALAISIDATILILSIGMMFFRGAMSRWGLAGIWIFVLGLTAFSLIVNWEYAVQFQGNGLSKATNLWWLNPILASSFALLNIAYSLVAELFNSQPETAQDLQKKLDEMNQVSEIKQEISKHKNKQVSSWISGKFQIGKDIFSGMKSSEELPQDVAVHSMPVSKPEEEEILPESETPQDLPMMVIPDSIEQESEKLFMTFEEASQYTGYAESTLKKQLSLGQIRLNKKGDKLVVSSLKIKGVTLELPSVRIDKSPATNGHRS